MKRMALGVVVVLMGGTVAGADEPTPAQIAESEAQSAADGKNREQLDKMVEELTKKVDEDRSRLQIAEATLTKLKDIRDGDPVRREFGVQSLHGGKKLFRNVGVGRTTFPNRSYADVITSIDNETDAKRSNPIEQRLGDIERKLDKILKELEGAKTDSPIGETY